MVFNVIERVAFLCILASTVGKNTEANASTSNGRSSIPIAPGCLSGIADNTFLMRVSPSVVSSPNIALLNSISNKISPKNINPAGCTNLLNTFSQVDRF